MGVFSALLTGVSGLNGQSTKMGSISDNIANVNTVGYKQVDVPFQTLVTERIGSTRFQPGGVLSRPRQTLDVQGVIQNTTNSLDMAISGRGFFIVTDDPSGGLDNARFFTRAGSFRPVIDNTTGGGADDPQLLQNVGGFYLMGFRLNSDGEVVTGDNDQVVAAPTSSDLEVINLREINQQAQATTDIATRMNLPAELEPSADSVSIFASDGSRIVFDQSSAAGATTTSNALDAAFIDLDAVPADAVIATITGPDGQKISLVNSTAENTDTIWNVDLQDFGGGGVTTATALTSLQDFLNLLDQDTATFSSTEQTEINTQTTVSAGATSVAGLLADLTAAQTAGAANGGATYVGTGLKLEDAYDAAIASAAQSLLDNDSLTQARTEANTAFTDTLKNFTLDSGDTVQFDAVINGSSGQVQIRALLNFLDGSDTQGLQIAEFNSADATNTNPITFTDATDATVFGQFAFAGASGANMGFATAYDPDFTSAFQIFDAQGSTHNVNVNWKRRLDEANLWEIRITDDDVSDYNTTDHAFDAEDPDDNGVRFVVTEDASGDGAAINTQRLFLKFNGDGSLAEVRTTADGSAGETLEGASVNGTVDNRETDSDEAPKLISVAMGPTLDVSSQEELVEPDENFGGSNNAPFIADENDNADETDPGGAEAVVFEWNIGRPTNLAGGDAGTGLDGITQFDSGESVPVIETFFFSQNGARFGNATGFEIDDNGILSAFFDNGVSTAIYQVPLATFANPNGLSNLTGNAYQQSTASGEPQLKDAGDQGAGIILGASLEQSNVDLGDEFTDMIITQQAFTANTRTITTADRMLEELVRILR